VFKKFGLGFNTHVTRYMFISRHKYEGENHNSQATNECLESVTKSKYFLNVSKKFKSR